MNEFETLGEKRQIPKISLGDAENILKRGLKHFAGDSYQWLPKYDAIVDWLTDNKQRGLLLHGGNGLGKSLVCMRIFPVIWKYYLHREYYDVDAIMMGEYYKNPVDKWHLIGTNKDLIIDDFGVEAITNSFGEKIDLFSMLVDLAEKRGRLLILTTNLSPDEIQERYGLRTLDRLHGLTRSIEITGESLRG